MYMKEKGVGIQDRANQQEKNSTVQLKEGERSKTNTKQILQTPKHLFHSQGGWEGQHPNIRSSNSANPKIHEVSKSTQVTLYLWSQRWKQEAKAPIVHLLPHGPFSLIHQIIWKPSHLSFKATPFPFYKYKKAQETMSLHSLTTHHTDNTQRGLHIEDSVLNSELKKKKKKRKT